MDSSKFVKFCKDSGIIDDRTFKMSDAGNVSALFFGRRVLNGSLCADLLFQRSKKAGNYGKKITYEEFRTVAFPAVALKKEVSQADLAEIVIRLGRRGIDSTDATGLHSSSVVKRLLRQVRRSSAQSL